MERIYRFKFAFTTNKIEFQIDMNMKFVFNIIFASPQKV